MNDLQTEARSFRADKTRQAREARQIVAVQLALGIDLATALAAPPAVRLQAIHNLQRKMERERLRGLRRHWSYDLNRHIALKQALDRLRESLGAGVEP